MVQPPWWGNDHRTPLAHISCIIKSSTSQTRPWLRTLPGMDLPRESTKQVRNRCGTMPQHPRVGLHRLATLRLRWTPNHETHCERVPVDLLRGWYLSTTPSTWCGLQLAAETKTWDREKNTTTTVMKPVRCDDLTRINLELRVTSAYSAFQMSVVMVTSVQLSVTLIRRLQVGKVQITCGADVLLENETKRRCIIDYRRKQSAYDP